MVPGVVHFVVPSTTAQDSPALHVPFAKHGPLSTPWVAVVLVDGSSPTQAAIATEPTNAAPNAKDTRSFRM